MQVIKLIPIGGTLPETISQTDFYAALNKAGSINVPDKIIKVKDKQYKLDTLNITGDGAGGYSTRTILVPFESGQTEFTLPSAPSLDFQPLLTINGLVHEFGVDYSIAGTTLTWLNGDIVLNPTDRMVLYHS